MSYYTGPFVTFMVHKTSYRTTTILGSFLLCVGLLIVAYGSHIVMYGIGYFMAGE